MLCCRDKEHSTIFFEGPADNALHCAVLHCTALFGTALYCCRDKEHSTIIFEGPADTPLLRLGWNKQDPRYIATLVADSPKVRLV